MKTYVSAIMLLLCTLTAGIKAQNDANKAQKSGSTECFCCSDCKDDKCKELCKKWSELSADARKGEEGKKVKEECSKRCEEKKCCSSSSKKACKGMNEKGCCSKK